MKRNRILRVLRFILFVALFVTVSSFIVMGLWNRLLPTIFGLHSINFWQALGLLILSKILFGGFRGRPGHHWYWRHRMMERWEQMSPEEREKFRHAIRGRCGSLGSRTAEPKA